VIIVFLFLVRMIINDFDFGMLSLIYCIKTFCMV